MPQTNTNTNQNNDSDVERALRWQEMSLEDLHSEAEKLGIELKDQAEKADIIDALLSASTETPDTAEPGVLISLHSRDDSAKALVLTARNIILQNEEAGKTFSLFLQNKEGNFYKQTNVPGARIQPATLQKVLAIVSPLPDGSQSEVLAELRSNPSAFDEPLVVKMRRRNADNTYNSYVMLYVKRNQKLVEQTF